jgi:hypothetical protein
LASVATIERLVLDVILRTAMTGGAAAAVEKAVDAGAGAGYAGVSSACVDVGDYGGVGICRVCGSGCGCLFGAR